MIEQNVIYNKDTPIELFSQKTDEFFNMLNIQRFTTKDEALDFVITFDDLIELLRQKLVDDNMQYSEETLLFFGCPLGEALCMIFGAKWGYSTKDNKWVLESEMYDGAIVRLNVFRKVENRILNGEEDSIKYYYESTKAIIDNDGRLDNLSQ